MSQFPWCWRGGGGTQCVPSLLSVSGLTSQRWSVSQCSCWLSRYQSACWPRCRDHRSSPISHPAFYSLVSVEPACHQPKYTTGKKVTSNTLIRVPICDSITRHIKIENIEHDKNNNHFTHQEDLNKSKKSFVN